MKHQTMPYPDLCPEIGEVWEVVFKHNRKHEEVKQMRLINKTELTYIFAEPDDNPYYPVRYNIRISQCVLNQKIPTDFQTRINGYPSEFYDSRIQTGPRKPPLSFHWSFNPVKYLAEI